MLCLKILGTSLLLLVMADSHAWAILVCNQSNKEVTGTAYVNNIILGSHWPVHLKVPKKSHAQVGVGGGMFETVTLNGDEVANLDLGNWKGRAVNLVILVKPDNTMMCHQAGSPGPSPQWCEPKILKTLWWAPVCDIQN